MGKLDAILATYASVYGAMKRKEKQVARAEAKKRRPTSSAHEILGESSSSTSSAVTIASSSSAAPEVPSSSSVAGPSRTSTVNHLSVLRDTQRLWMSATAEHRAALEIIAESQYCRGIYPQLRQRLPHVPQYCTTTLNYPTETDESTPPTMDDSLKKYHKYQDPSKKYALRLPLYKEAMFRKEPISMDTDDEEDDQEDHNDIDDPGSFSDAARKRKRQRSTVKKKHRNKAYRMIRISKREALKECLRRQPHVLRALQQAKRRPTLPLTSSATAAAKHERPPVVYIDWTKVPRPVRLPASSAADHARGSRGRRRSAGAETAASRRADGNDEEEEDEDGDEDDSGSQHSHTSSQSDGNRSHSSGDRRGRRPRSGGRHSRRHGSSRPRPSSSSSDDDDDEEEEEEEEEEEINIL